MYHRAIVLAVVFLSGCVTLEDFQEMSASQRANLVCSGSNYAGRFDSRIRNLQNDISETRNALRLGYRIHKSCKYEKVPKQGAEYCTTVFDIITECESTTEYTREKVCEDIPVSIDGDFEKSKLEDYSNELTSVRTKRLDVYNDCYSSVITLTPGQAYQLYQLY